MTYQSNCWVTVACYFEQQNRKTLPSQKLEINQHQLKITFFPKLVFATICQSKSHRLTSIKKYFPDFMVKMSFAKSILQHFDWHFCTSHTILILMNYKSFHSSYLCDNDNCFFWKASPRVEQLEYSFVWSRKQIQISILRQMQSVKKGPIKLAHRLSALFILLFCFFITIA